MMETMDQRCAPRVRVQEFRLELPDGQRFVQGNVSMGGVGFEIDECLAIAVGDTIRVSLAVEEDEDPLDLVANVRHVRMPGRGSRLYVGASFRDLDVLVGNPLYRFVEESLLEARRPVRERGVSRASALNSA